jgi:hypothetical protein
LAKIVRHRNPPVDHLFFIICFRVVFIFVSLIRDDGDHSVLLAGFNQFTQMNEPRFGGFIRYANTHMR